MEFVKANKLTNPQDAVVKIRTTNYFKIAFFALLALVVCAVAISAAVLIKVNEKKEATEHNIEVHTTDGRTISEVITMTDIEEDILLEDGSRVILDYSKGFKVFAVLKDDRVTCYVTHFVRRDIHAPTVDALKTLNHFNNVTMSEEVHYEIERSAVVNRHILSERSRHACTGADTILWMTKIVRKDDHRQKRWSHGGTVFRTDSCAVHNSEDGIVAWNLVAARCGSYTGTTRLTS